MATTLPPFASSSKAAQAPPLELELRPPPPNPELEYDIELVNYRGEGDLAAVIALIEKELSEPYLIYTYRYFLNEWPHLAWLAHSIPKKPRPPPLPPRSTNESATLSSQVDTLTLTSFPQDVQDDGRAESNVDIEEHRNALRRAPVGVIVNKLDRHLKGDRLMRGYIAMLSIHPAWRSRGIARKLVQTAVDRMEKDGADEVVLETEVDNVGALALYEALGFMREKRLHRFYLNAKDSFRLVLPLVGDSVSDEETREAQGPDEVLRLPAREQPAPVRPSRPDAFSSGDQQLYDFDGLIM
ncbi:hypothetical protein A4X06_0g2232 [Tilletia controversa]|uniref:N-acetyltransferase domain-containing protein n=1 Tax=Tilletia controversa TaxID=13291 RepID=A0A8X7MY03_9BASI|nr:hypothetical protein CF328_g1742 [Tilletia controversa]KAE8252378.1 hypothetical protein A4X06_0g2232 [Tilletia controversa]